MSGKHRSKGGGGGFGSGRAVLSCKGEELKEERGKLQVFCFPAQAPGKVPENAAPDRSTVHSQTAHRCPTPPRLLSSDTLSFPFLGRKGSPPCDAGSAGETPCSVAQSHSMLRQKVFFLRCKVAAPTGELGFVHG